MTNDMSDFYIATSPLPTSRDVDKNKVLQLFHKTTTSYKYLFFMSLLRIMKRDNFESKIISFDDLATNMLAIAWYPYKLFKLSFGLSDQIPHELDNIHVDAIDSLDSSTYMSYNKKLFGVLSEANASSKLMRYVPFRLLQPFFEEELRGKADGEKNSLIIHIAREQFEEVRPFYYLDTENRTIVLHPAWRAYFYENYELVESFTKWEWLSYMQKRNPSVPALQSKLFPQVNREGMALQTRFWKNVIQVKPITCIYSKERITLNNFSLDHFIPWSFVAHNQLWNLIPTPKGVNSSKLNNMPSLIKYFDAYADLQYEGLSIYRKLAGDQLWRKTIEPYQVDLKIKADDILNINYLKKQLRSTIDPLVSIASNMGFISGWVF